MEAPPPLTGDWTARAGYDLGRQISAADEVTALFVANDQMALGVLRAMHETGRQVPSRSASSRRIDDVVAVLHASADDRSQIR